MRTHLLCEPHLPLCSSDVIVVEFHGFCRILRGREMRSVYRWIGENRQSEYEKYVVSVLHTAAWILRLDASSVGEIMKCLPQMLPLRAFICSNSSHKNILIVLLQLLSVWIPLHYTPYTHRPKGVGKRVSNLSISGQWYRQNWKNTKQAIR